METKEPKQKKQFRQLTDEELEKVTGGKDQINGSQNPCESQAYKEQYPDECVNFSANFSAEEQWK